MLRSPLAVPRGHKGSNGTDVRSTLLALGDVERRTAVGLRGAYPATAAGAADIAADAVAYAASAVRAVVGDDVAGGGTGDCRTSKGDRFPGKGQLLFVVFAAVGPLAGDDIADKSADRPTNFRGRRH